jgi:malonate transporter and related proteins
MTIMIASAFAPVFAMIALGWIVRASGLMGRPLWNGVNALNHRVLLPSFLFVLIAQAGFGDAGAGTLALASSLGSLIMIALGLAAGHLLRLKSSETAGLVAVAALWNLVLTMALAQRLFGPETAGAAVVLPGVLLGAGAAVAGFAISQGAGPRAALVRIVRDPVLIACVAGLAANITALARMPALLTPLELTAAGSMAVILLAMGAGLDFEALKGRLRALAAAALLRSLISPAIYLALALGFGLRGEEAALLALAGGAPAAAVTYAFAADFKAEPGLVAGMITLTVLTSALTLPLVTALALLV